MNWLRRWGRFNVVGMMGMAVQLGTLAGLNRWAPGRYLWTSAAAVELTLLHNFAWHLNYTWRDRRESSSVAEKLVRFHLSNGLVSMAGNLGLMRVLMAEARIPLLAANGAAIAICSVVNFCLGNGWAFGASQQASRAEWQESIPAAVFPLPPIQNRVEDEHSPMKVEGPKAQRPSASGRPLC